MTPGYDVYRWASGVHHSSMLGDQAAVAAGQEFLRAHGIDPQAFVVGNELVVREHEDGNLWLHTWRAAGNLPLSEAEMCEHCPDCVKQVRVEVPLAAPVPMLPGAWVSDRRTVPTVAVAGEVDG